MTASIEYNTVIWPIIAIFVVPTLCYLSHDGLGFTSFCFRRLG